MENGKVSENYLLAFRYSQLKKVFERSSNHRGTLAIQYYDGVE